MTRKSQTTNSNTDQIIDRARGMKAPARAEFLRRHSVPEIVDIHTTLLGAPKPKTPRPVMERRILESLAAQAPSAEPGSKPLEEALATSETGAANAASWDGALPEPGYVPPAGTGDDAPDAGDDAAGDDDATTAAPDDAGAPTGEPGADDGATGGPAAITGATAKPTKTSAPKVDRAPRERDPRLPAIGTILIKADRHGQERVRCTILADGVEYAGTVYKSLSGAGLQASKDLGNTTTTCDGLAFWGLKKATPRAATTRDPLASLTTAWEKYRERAAAAAKAEGTDERAKVHAAINEHVAALQALTAAASA